MIRFNLLRIAAFSTALLGAATLASAQQPAPDTVVATVDGKPVTMADLEQFKQGISQAAQIPTASIFDILVDRVVSSRLLSQAGYAGGLDKTEDVQKQMEMIEQQLVARAEVDRIVKAGATDARVEAAYQAYLKETPTADEVKASHILLDDEEKAKAVIAELKAGADFAETAKTKSIGPSGPNGGDLGFFQAEQMVKEFSDAAFALEVGAITETPVKSQFGWHVIKVTDKKIGTPPTMEEIRPQLEDQIGVEVLQERLAELREKATIVTYNIDGTAKTEPAPAAAPAETTAPAKPAQ
ncbi:MAG: peptidylprolyl isomerase [Rhodospirillales bacterium]